MASIAISSGHGQKVRGASASPRPPYLDEVDEARKVVDRVYELLNGGAVKVAKFHENTATSVNQNLTNITNWHNAQSRERDVSVHFNAYSKTSKPMGTECLYVTQSALASEVSRAMSTSGGFINRGPKYRSDLWFLNKCAKPAILLEVCFVDSSADGDLYRKNFDNLCRAIAESIASVKLEGTEPPPIEPPVEPEPPPVTGANVVEINITAPQGDPHVTLNGEAINEGNQSNRCDLTLEYQGDVVITVNGETWDVKPPPPPTDRPTLRKGDTGDQVRVVQTALKITADGIFGNDTETAVRSFQTTKGLTVDGVVGPETWAALEEEFDLPPYEPPESEWQENIKTSVFGGKGDPNNSAYSPYDVITDTELSVALPYKFPEPRPKVLVRNRANGKEAVCRIRDLGPWLTDDPYWNTGQRPLAETCWQTKTPLPRGPNKGKVPNGAGLDVTPGAAKAIALSGMGQCDWTFV